MKIEELAKKKCRAGRKFTITSASDEMYTYDHVHVNGVGWWCVVHDGRRTGKFQPAERPFNSYKEYKANGTYVAQYWKEVPR